MKKVRVMAQTVPVNVEVDISIEEMIRALKKECGVVDDYDSFYSVKGKKLYRHTDISRHGSPHYRDTVVSEDPNIIEMFKGIEAYERAYKLNQNKPQHCCCTMID